MIQRSACSGVIESVQNADGDPTLGPRDKMERWERLLELYPKRPGAAEADLQIGRLLERSGALQKAAAHYQAFARRWPEQPLVLPWARPGLMWPWKRPMWF